MAHHSHVGMSFCTLPRALASGGQGGAAALPGPPEPDKLCLWMDLFSLDSVILIVVTWNIVCHFREIEREIEKLVGPRCVQIVSKRLVSQTSCSIVRCLVY